MSRVEPWLSELIVTHVHRIIDVDIVRYALNGNRRSTYIYVRHPRNKKQHTSQRTRKQKCGRTCVSCRTWQRNLCRAGGNRKRRNISRHGRRSLRAMRFWAQTPWRRKRIAIRGFPRLLELLFVSINIDESPRGFETLLQFQDCEQKGPRFNGEDERARMCVLPAFVRTIVSVPCLLFGQRMLLASRTSVTKAEESVTVVEDFALYSQTLETSSYAIRRRNIFYWKWYNLDMKEWREKN